MTLLICPVREGEANEELRYALRSWETNLLLDGGLDLLVVGHRPSWLWPDAHVEGNKHDSVQANVWDNIWLGSHEARFEREPALYMNDDFFCMDPVLQVPVVRRHLTLAEHVGLYPQHQHLWFVRSLALTDDWLTEAGFRRPWSYDLHRPLPALPAAMSRALSKWDGGLEGDIPQWRSFYGNLEGVHATPVLDVKLATVAHGNTINQHSPWVSTSDTTWRRVSRQMMQRFRKPSRWEKS